MILWFLVVFLMAGVGLAMLVVLIVAMIKAYNLQKWKIPLVGKFAEKYAS
jgi:uncharacterized membrane protein